MHADGAQLKTLAALYDAGTLHPVLDRTFDFDDTLAYVEQGKANARS
jgi:NADPH:quinone reductase-like Zn-dependent oxidoreductase